MLQTNFCVCECVWVCVCVCFPIINMILRFTFICSPLYVDWLFFSLIANSRWICAISRMIRKCEFMEFVQSFRYLQIKVKSQPCWASLVAQWLRICLPMQGTRGRALVWEDPTCRRATRSVSHNYWACVWSLCSTTREACARRWRVAPTCRN